MNINILKQLLETGAHLGNITNKWNPQVKPFLYGKRNNTHIINLEKTVVSLRRAMQLLYAIKNNGGKVLFVGTDELSSKCVRHYAQKAGQYYIHKNWLGGILTNWSSIGKYIQTNLQNMDQLAQSKHVATNIIKRRQRLLYTLEGVIGMNSLPQAIIVFNTKQNKYAIEEARRINIPVIALVDTDTSLDGITYPIPSSDDQVRLMELYCHLLTVPMLPIKN